MLGRFFVMGCVTASMAAASGCAMVGDSVAELLLRSTVEAIAVDSAVVAACRNSAPAGGEVQTTVCPQGEN